MAFTVGKPILVRELHRGRVYSVRPGWLAAGDRTSARVYFGAGTQCLWPCDAAGRGLRVPEDDWQLVWGGWLGASQLHHLQLGAGHTVALQWRGPEREFRGYKVDFHAPVQASAFGFDSLDWALDLLIAPDGSHRVKDQDEFAALRQRGLLSESQTQQVLSLMEHVLGEARELRGPFAPEWRRWAPDPTWEAPPPLPEDWERVRE